MSFPRSRRKPVGGFHTPEKSGVPSACRGGGALRFGLPSAPSGTCAGGTLLHWAETTHDSRNANPNCSKVFIVASPSAVARRDQTRTTARRPLISPQSAREKKRPAMFRRPFAVGLQLDSNRG